MEVAANKALLHANYVRWAAFPQLRRSKSAANGGVMCQGEYEH